MYHADSCFHIGTSHHVCEDYARSGLTEPPMTPSVLLPKDPEFKAMRRAYGIVSDGCSGSPDTDHGARFLTMAAANRLNTWGDDFDTTWVAWQAYEMARDPLPKRCLDATLLTMFERADGHVEVMATGDGVIVAVQRDGQIITFDIDYEGYPLYLSYQYSAERLQGYLDNGCKRTVTIYQDGEEIGTRVSVPKTPKDMEFSFAMAFSPQEFSLVMVMSDGAHTFRRMEQGLPVGIPLHDVVQELAHVKRFRGAFMARRVQAMKREWTHTDDFSVATIHIPDPGGTTP